MTIIALDFDGVVADVGKAVCYGIKQLYNKDITPEEITTYSLYDSFGIDYSKEAAFNTLFCNEKLIPISGALEGLSTLQKWGYNLIFATKRRDEQFMLKWLHKYEIKNIPIYFLYRQPMVEVDYLLDDSPEKIVKLLPFIKERAFLMWQPWNYKCRNLENNFNVVDNWPHFLKQVSPYFFMGGINV